MLLEFINQNAERLSIIFLLIIVILDVLNTYVNEHFIKQEIKNQIKTILAITQAFLSMLIIIVKRLTYNNGDIFIIIFCILIILEVILGFIERKIKHPTISKISWMLTFLQVMCWVCTLACF